MEAFDLTLYEMSYSRSFRVKWLATELKVIDKIKLEHVALRKGVQNQPSFKKMNHMQAVPTLVLTDKKSKEEMIMTESAAICMFLTDSVAAGASLKPAASNTLGMAAYLRYIVFAVASADAILWQVRVHEGLLPEELRVPSVAKMARKEFKEKVIPALEDVLGAEGEVEYICEPYHKGFTTADIMVGYCCYWARAYNLLDDSAILRRYLKRVEDREAFGTAMAKKASL